MTEPATSTVTTTTTNDGPNIIDQRLFTTTTTKSTGVHIPNSSDSVAAVRRRLVRDVSTTSLSDDLLAASSERPFQSSVDEADPTPVNDAYLSKTNDDPRMNAARTIVDDILAAKTESQSETEAIENSAHARCTAVARWTRGEHDARLSVAPPDVAADTDVLATAAVDTLAADQSPFTAVTRAAVRAASAAVGDVIWQVREVVGDMARDVVELELSARCVVTCHSSQQLHRSAREFHIRAQTV